MVIRGDDYKIEGEGIWLSKELLENYKRHYMNVAEGNRDKWKKNEDTFRYPFYLGKVEVLIDILKMFEPLVED